MLFIYEYMNIYNIHKETDTPIEEELADLSEFFRVFGDPTRLQILFFLLNNPETGVNQLSELLGLHQTAVSHQLKILRQLRLVRYRKNGRNVYYSLSDHHIHDILHIGMEHIQEGSI